jgi:lipopolysaccharide assembly outer membrane protein LptD (OstA)
MNRTGENRPSRRRGFFLFLALLAATFFELSHLPAAPHAPRAAPQNASQTAPQTAVQTPPPATPQQTLTPASSEATDSSTKVIKADKWEKIGNIITATGNVEISNGEIILYADRVVYDEKTKDVTADGHVSVIQGENAFTAEHLTFNMESGLGKAEKVAGLVQPQYRYESSVFERKTPDLFDLGKCRVTGCSQPVPQWEFSASHASFLRNEYVEMWNPVLRIKNIPILYLPYMRYPLNQRPETGFLMPRIGYSARKGFSLTQQFYLAVARNMDATLSLDYYSTAGIGGGLEYRYLFADGMGGQINAYYFAYKTPTTGVKPDNALLLRWTHNQKLPGNISFVANVDYQNSFSFTREFDNNYGRALSYNRSSQVYLTKSWGGANLSVRFNRSETSYATITQSYISQSLPQISFSTFKKRLLGPIYYSLSSTYNSWKFGTSSQYENGKETKSSELYFGPTIALPINTIPWFTLDLNATGHVSYYGNSRDPVTRKVIDKGLIGGNYVLSASLTGPILYRVYNFPGSGTKIKHMIEPNISYQFDSPTLNSNQIVTAWGYLFRYHDISYGLTNRVLIKKGDAQAKEVFTWGISQVYYFSPEKSPLSLYRLPDGSIPRFSMIQSYIRFYPGTKLNFDVAAGYYTYKSMLSNIRAAVTYGGPADDLYFSLSWYKSINPYYTDILFDRQQIGISGGVKLPSLDVEALGEFEYNISQNKILYTGLSLAWNWQCLNFKVDAQEFFFRAKPEFQVHFSIGLGNITSSADSLTGSQAGRKGRKY